LNGQEQQQTQEQPTPGQYRKLVIEACQTMLPVLNLEFQTMSQQGASPFDQACFIIAMQVIGELNNRAETLEKQALDLVVANNPGLVDPNGNPISRPARRKIARQADEMEPTALLNGDDPQA
jgi:hypothetical protein